MSLLRGDLVIKIISFPRIIKKGTLRRMGNPEDIALSIVFLLFDDAKYITGQNLILNVDWTSIWCNSILLE